MKGRDNIFHGCQQLKDSYANWAKMKCRAVMYTLCRKGPVQIAHLYICESYKTMNTTKNWKVFVLRRKSQQGVRKQNHKPLTDKVPLGKLFCTTLNGHHKHQMTLKFYD